MGDGAKRVSGRRAECGRQRGEIGTKQRIDNQEYVIPFLSPHDPFPPVDRALRDPNGLLAAGADLSPERLLDAYAHGIFPWFGDDDPVLWWSPDPRMVLFTSEVHVSRSLRKTIRSGRMRSRWTVASRRSWKGAPRLDGSGRHLDHG